MKRYVCAVFETGRNVLLSVNINPDSHISTHTAFTALENLLAHDNRKKFSVPVKNELLAIGAAITSDGVNLSVKNTHYYNVTKNYVRTNCSNFLCGSSKMRIRNRTIVLFVCPSLLWATNLHCCFRNALRENMLYQCTPCRISLLSSLTVPQCWPKIAGSSMNRSRNTLGHKLIRNLVHTLNDALKVTLHS